MNAQTARHIIAGPAGAIEVLVDQPAQPSLGYAFVCHPHPLFGGTMDNKVVQTLTRAFVQAGWTSVRFNFRGVGASTGQHDQGVGETDDLLHLVAHLAPSGPLALAGFSFGSYVTCRVLAALHPLRDVRHVVLVGPAAARFDVPLIPADLHDRTLVVHGEMDDTVPLADAMRWARPQALPILVVPGGGHFFHGQLPLLKGLVARHLRA